MQLPNLSRFLVYRRFRGVYRRFLGVYRRLKAVYRRLRVLYRRLKRFIGVKQENIKYRKILQ